MLKIKSKVLGDTDWALLACEQALLFGLVKRVSRELTCPNRRACSQTRVLLEHQQWNLNIMKGQGTGNNITRYNEVSFHWIFFHIFYYYWGQENILLYQGLRYIEVHYIKVPLYHFNLFIFLNTGKDGRDGRDGSGIKVGFFKLQTLLSLSFAWKVQKFKLNDPWSCMFPIKWSLLCECIIKLPKRGFFGHLRFSLSRERRIRYKIIFKKLII